ncbi:Uncharacterised protein [Mycobacteroides abscessus subsp. abscessus]|nr:Uncharacterised protein [Mycobacteroides abscessus subsp. abscessus]SHX00903.1 Uncharacterised protein [Mycobacteroides abscessus subsp. abscessus]SKG95604.1 Uncharacterised protein [Mycobacteroides abscessus subsp. abscessus]SKH50379.1 Uncharacterised protein [Mycobacteroides abscessus subsp. abscessus]SKH65956.1 Uncharacterised protein [Mycobacteroides abscessus subsp. abscessus]
MRCAERATIEFKNELRISAVGAVVTSVHLVRFDQRNYRSRA